jgi:N-acetylglucosamine kinase-like BadF-type ATPase
VVMFNTPAFEASKKSSVTEAVPAVVNTKEQIALMCEEADCIISIDGGGSKTLVQVLNSKLEVLELEYEGITTTLVVCGPGNINTAGLLPVQQMLEKVLAGIKVGTKGLYLKDIDNKAIICGLAGLVSNADKIQAIMDVFASAGFKSSKIHLSSDVDLAKHLIEENGAILISGTGSICFSKTLGKEKRIGGYGYALGDEGSGYYVGKLALQAALEAKFEDGEPFILTEALCSLFNITAPINVNEAIKLFYSGTLKPADIAKATPFVFDAAFKQNDERCMHIIGLCTTELAKLITRAVKGDTQENYPIYLIGGLFKNENSELFIEMIRKKVDYNPGLKFINVATENIAVQVALTQRGVNQAKRLIVT